MPELIPRVVFDCNLFVQGIANRNSPARKDCGRFQWRHIALYERADYSRSSGCIESCGGSSPTSGHQVDDSTKLMALAVICSHSQEGEPESPGISKIVKEISTHLSEPPCLILFSRKTTT